MKMIKVIAGVVLVVGMLTGYVLANEAEVVPVEVGNKICPVSGEKVGEMGDVVKVEHNGKMYNLCCSMCKKDFNNNTEKFTKVAEDEAAVVNN